MAKVVNRLTQNVKKNEPPAFYTDIIKKHSNFAHCNVDHPEKSQNHRVLQIMNRYLKEFQ